MRRLFKYLVLVWISTGSALLAQSTSVDAGAGALSEQAELDHLFLLLRQSDDSNWQALEDEIWQHWSASGSPSMDLLLERGREALEADDIESAIEHFSALTDHAPQFAEGWNARATAFYRAGELGLALADIAQTLALEPRHFSALTGLGIIFEELGDETRALAAYRYALDIHPQRPDLKDAIARLDAATGRDI